MDKRYLIFISSTYSDLITERDKVTQAVLELNHFPAGMEQFPAVGIPPIELIKSYLKECDYYILIVAARYGSTYEDGSNRGKSFTEVEYDIATELGIPVIAFLHNDIKSIPSGKTDEDDVKREKLLKFRAKVEKGNQTVKYWSNPDDLKAKVLSSIPSAIKYQERTGWVRANDEEVNNEAQKKIEYLQKEVKELKHQVTEKERTIIEKEEYNKYSQMTIKNLETEIKRLRPLDSDNSGKKSLSQMRTFLVKGVEFKMVYVEGGTFIMGGDETDIDTYPNESPRHEVTLSGYYIGETQVTQALWRAVMGENPSTFKRDPNYPVTDVSWVDCRNFIRQLNKLVKLTDMKFHLPTEAQWEFAARGGIYTKGYKYAGSKDIFDVAWFNDNSKGQIHPVAEMEPNELHLFDMSGNVEEWCQDYFGLYNNDAISESDPTGPENGDSRIIRGGHFGNVANRCRVTSREYTYPKKASGYVGLRLALVPIKE